MREYSAYQQKLIKNYYENLDGIMVQKLQELVSDAFLADSPRKKTAVWDRVRKALVKLKVPAKRIDQICERQKPEELAEAVQNILSAD